MQEMDCYLAGLQSLSILRQLEQSPLELDNYKQCAMRVYNEYTLVLAHHCRRAARRWDDTPWGHKWLLGALDHPRQDCLTPLHVRADEAAVGLGVDLAILTELLGRLS